MSNYLNEYLLTIYGYEKLMGTTGKNLDEIREEIGTYSCKAILTTSSKIILKMYSTGFASRETQVNLVKDIFAQDLELRKNLVKQIQEYKDRHWVVFSYQIILVIMKIALEECKWDTGKDVTEREVLNYGYWVLQVTDLLIGDEEVVKKLNKEEIREHFARQHFLMYNDRLPYMTGRFAKILETIVNDSRIDALGIFEEATNKTQPLQYLQYCFYILVNWVNKTTKKPDITKEWVICRDKYFEQTKLDKVEIQKVIDLLAQNQEEYNETYANDVDTILSGEDNYIYNLLAFQKKPFIKYDDNCLVCTHPKFLMEKVYSGFYWQIENYLRKTNNKVLRNLFPVVWGDAFHTYTEECLSEGFKESYYPPFIDNSHERYDAAVELQNVILFFETKAVHFTLKAKLTGDKESMERTLKHLFSKNKGLGQIIKNINDLRRKKWQLPFPQNKRPILPVIVTGESLPMESLHRKLYEDYAKENGAYYSSKKVLPFIILYIEEIEMLEAIASEKGIDEAERLILEYAKLFQLERNEHGFLPEAPSFKNFLDFIQYEVPNNERLMNVFTDFVKDATRNAFFEELE